MDYWDRHSQARSNVRNAGGEEDDPLAALGFTPDKLKEMMEKSAKMDLSKDLSKLEGTPGLTYDPEKKTVKFLGIFDMPPEMANMLAMGYQTALQPIMRAGQGMATKQSHKLWNRIYKSNPDAAKSLALKTGVAFPLLIALTPDAIRAKNAIIDYNNARRTLLEEASPVLERLHGKSTLAKLFSTSDDQNEVIACERARIGRKFKEGLFTTIAGTAAHGSLLASSIIKYRELSEDARNGSFLGEKKDPKTVAQTAREEAQQLADEEFGHSAPSGRNVAEWEREKRNYKTEWEKHFRDQEQKRQNANDRNRDANRNTAMDIVGPSASVMVAKMLEGTIRRRFESEDHDLGAYQMIRQLAKEIEAEGTGLSEYKMPKGIKGSYSLERYVEEIFRQHQKSMGRDDIGKPRAPALKEAAKQIARAIRNEEIDPWALLALVGERKIVKAEGKRVASEGEVERELTTLRRTLPAHKDVDAKAYDLDSTFTREDLKKALATLKGEERMLFAAPIPDNILKEAGMGEEEIQAMRGQFAEQAQLMPKLLGDAARGLLAQGESQLTVLGVDKHGLSQLKDIAKHYAQESGAANKNRADANSRHEDAHQLANALVPYVLRTGSMAPVLESAVNENLSESAHGAANSRIFGGAEYQGRLDPLREALRG